MDMPVDVGNNQIIQDCLSHYNYTVDKFDSFEFNKASSCYLQKKHALFVLPEMAEIRDFLDANPQYRYPGGSNGNYNPCWGRNKQYHKDGGC